VSALSEKSTGILQILLQKFSDRPIFLLPVLIILPRVCACSMPLGDRGIRIETRIFQLFPVVNK